MADGSNNKLFNIIWNYFQNTHKPASFYDNS